MLAITKSSLSPSRKQLIELMQRINFGRIENLLVRQGEPVLSDPALKVFLEVKFCAENGPRPESANGDFALKAQVIDLLAHIEKLHDARIEVLSIKHGLPFHMHVEAAGA